MDSSNLKIFWMDNLSVLLQVVSEKDFVKSSKFAIDCVFSSKVDDSVSLNFDSLAIGKSLAALLKIYINSHSTDFDLNKLKEYLESNEISEEYSTIFCSMISDVLNGSPKIQNAMNVQNIDISQYRTIKKLEWRLDAVVSKQNLEKCFELLYLISLYVEKDNIVKKVTFACSPPALQSLLADLKQAAGYFSTQ